MNNQSYRIRIMIVFVTLSIAGIGMTASSRLVTGGIERTTLIALGSAIFGAALNFLLVRLFVLSEK